MADRDDGAQARVQAAIDRRVASGAEVGMQVVVVRHTRRGSVSARLMR